MTYQALISNPLTLPPGRDFAAILGANPSQGARSPLLWDTAFGAHGLETRMVAMDVTDDNLDRLLHQLNGDPQFVGGAVAVPHKEAIAAWLDTHDGARITPEAVKIGAVNSLYRDDAGRLTGTNTDGEGALVSLRQVLPDLAGKRVLQLGVGGAGRAVATYLADALNDPRQLTLAVRYPDRLHPFAARIEADLMAWPPDPERVGDVDVIVNCTTIGSKLVQETDRGAVDLSLYSALAALDDGNAEASTGILANLRPGGGVFDIIYDPAKTVLLDHAETLGLVTLNGSGMNLEQAVIAFGHALAGRADMTRVRDCMELARSG